MSYRLIITRPDGTESQSSTEPLPDREAVGMSALRVLAYRRVAFGRGGMEFGRQVRDAAIGATVEHVPSGCRFRTEPF